jgi:acid phosphatase family membrane protein YuiD
MAAGRQRRRKSLIINDLCKYWVRRSWDLSSEKVKKINKKNTKKILRGVALLGILWPCEGVNALSEKDSRSWLGC